MEVTPAVLVAWESGEQEPFASQLALLSRLYGRSPDYLLGLEGDGDT